MSLGTHGREERARLIVLLIKSPRPLERFLMSTAALCGGVPGGMSEYT
jgi:hypothetical protein